MASKKNVVVGLGASMTAGTPGFLSPRERPPEGEGDVRSQYAYWMMQMRPHWKVLNRGMRGQRTDHLAMRFDYDVIENKPHFVIILGGTNDLYQGYDLSWPLKHLAAMYRRAEEEGIGVLACTLPPLNLADQELKKKISSFNHELKALADHHKTGFCDIYHAMEDPDNPGFIRDSPDQVHPGIEGYKKMAEALTAALDLMMKSSFSET